MGDLSVHWQLWEQHASEPDDIAEIFGSLDGSQSDDVVELYSPPRVVAAAAARGLKADLSINLVTGSANHKCNGKFEKNSGSDDPSCW